MNDPLSVEAAEKLYRELTRNRFEVLMDDREERAGVKFKDADLIGIPTQVILGEKALREGLVEIKDRKNRETVKVHIETAVDNITALMGN
jgi:prolyl-tRNA synthetase